MKTLDLLEYSQFLRHKYLEDVESRANANLSKITPEELAKNEIVLLGFFQEETHHRGELIALLWQMDVNPPHTGFLQYKLAQKHQ